MDFNTKLMMLKVLTNRSEMNVCTRRALDWSTDTLLELKISWLVDFFAFRKCVGAGEIGLVPAVNGPFNVGFSPGWCDQDRVLKFYKI